MQSDPPLRRCSACKTFLPFDSFGKQKNMPDGLQPICRACKSKRDKEYRERYPKKLKDYRLNNRGRIKGNRRSYYERNRDRELAQNNAYYKARKQTDIAFRLRTLLRTRLAKVIRRGTKSGSAVKDLGCSIQHLKLHLELFWDEGMSWDNYGAKEGQWSIDHIIPLASFDLTDREQFLKANHYTNLQPLWHVDNVKKNDSLSDAWRVAA